MKVVYVADERRLPLQGVKTDGIFIIEELFFESSYRMGLHTKCE